MEHCQDCRRCFRLSSDIVRADDSCNDRAVSQRRRQNGASAIPGIPLPSSFAARRLVPELPRSLKFHLSVAKLPDGVKQSAPRKSTLGIYSCIAFSRSICGARSDHARGAVVTVASALLGLVHGRVRHAPQVCRVFPIIRKQGDADAGAEMDLPFVQGVRRA